MGRTGKVKCPLCTTEVDYLHLGCDEEIKKLKEENIRLENITDIVKKYRPNDQNRLASEEVDMLLETDYLTSEEVDIDDCPDCGAPLTGGDNMSGVKCTVCSYWFCY